ncbi:hypothetical protein Chelonae_p2176 [[Mycobacterium] chelonae subsp. bovistauri]|nr:hypothetical protein Chelonae_p2176 [Mycobacterium sp. QIA-37]
MRGALGAQASLIAWVQGVALDGCDGNRTRRTSLGPHHHTAADTAIRAGGTARGGRRAEFGHPAMVSESDSRILPPRLSGCHGVLTARIYRA